MPDEWNRRYSEIAKKALHLICDEVEKLDIENNFSVIEKITTEMCVERKKWVETGYRIKAINVIPPDAEKKAQNNQMLDGWEGAMLCMDWKKFMEEFGAFDENEWFLEQFPTEKDYEIHKTKLTDRIKKFQNIYVHDYYESKIEIKIPMTKQEKMLKDSHFVSKLPMNEGVGMGIIGDGVTNDKVTERQKKELRKAFESR